jgi:hypothetical protein
MSRHEEIINSPDKQVLIPFHPSEAIPLKKGERIANKSANTLRDWAAQYGLGRRVGGGNWMLSQPALMMWLDGNHAALRAYHSGDRHSPLVKAYFARCNIDVDAVFGAPDKGAA